MLMGIRFQAKPTSQQAEVLCSWMGASKTIWNAKCEEDKYLRTFSRKYLPTGTFPKPNQTYSQYKNDELTPWLKKCPSQILRNTASNWFASYREFFKQKERGRPTKKRYGQGMSIHLTRELFQFIKGSHGLELFVGTKTNNIGVMDVNWHDKKWLQYGYPNSIRIKKLPSGKFTVSFCYGQDNKKRSEQSERTEWFKHLQEFQSPEELEDMIVGIDRGVTVAVATDEDLIPFDEKALKGLAKSQKKLKSLQKQFSRQKDKRSRRRYRRKQKIARTHERISNIRENQCHHISRGLVNLEKKVYVLEDLRTKNMTRSSKGTVENPGKQIKQKSGLNREILNCAWHKIETQLLYKARKANKVVFKINPAFTSQECANCGHTHPSNRNGITFKCEECGHNDHADKNAARVIKKRAVNLLLHSGTELSKKGVLCQKGYWTAEPG